MIRAGEREGTPQMNQIEADAHRERIRTIALDLYIAAREEGLGVTAAVRRAWRDGEGSLNEVWSAIRDSEYRESERRAEGQHQRAAECGNAALAIRLG